MLSQSSCSRVDLVFDQCRKQSIKERGDTREDRQAYWKLKSTNSDSTPILKQWGNYISNPRNKETLADFLCCALCKRFTQSLNPQQMVFLAGGFKDGMKTVSCTQGHCEIVPLLCPDHDKADTRLLLQAKHEIHPIIVIQSPDMDIAALSITMLKIYTAKSYGFKLE